MAGRDLRRSAAAAVVVALAAVGCTSTNGDRAAGSCTWTIGIMGALEDQFLEFGASPARGVEIAVDLANEGGDLACTLETRSEDTEADPDKAPARARALVEDEDLVACVCGYFSSETLATGDVFEQAGVAMLSTSERSDVREQGFETWFRLVTPVDRQAAATGLYIRRVFEPRRVAIVTVKVPAYSQEVASHLRAALGWRFQGPFVPLNPEESGVDDAAQRIRRMSADLVFFAGYAPEPWELFHAMRRSYGMTMPLLTDGGAIFEPTEDLRAVGGVRLSCACSDVTEIEGAEGFVSEYRARYGTAPQMFSADGFDGANAVIEALRELTGSESADEVRAHVVEYLDETDGVEGLAKEYAWDERGELITDSDDVWMWESTRRGGFRMLGSVAELIE